MWAITTPESVMVAGISLKGVYVPVVLGIMGGFNSTIACLKGLAVAMAAGAICDVKRWDGDSAVEVLY
jgi:hypothetical protein